MRLISVTINGFKNLKMTKITLQDITALIAVNNFGKTNLIDAIAFGFDFISQSSKARDRMMRWRKGIPLNPALENSPFYFDLEFENDNLAEHRYINYGFTFSWYNDKDKEGFITDEWIRTRKNTSVKYTSYLKRNEGKYRQSKIITSYKTIKLENKILAIDLLELFTDEEISEVAESIKSLKFALCDSLDADEMFNGPAIEFNDKEAQAFGSQQVPKIMWDLKKADEERYDILIESILDIFPEFNSIDVEYMKLDSKRVITIVTGENDKNTEEEDLNLPFKISDGIYRIMIQNKYLNQSVNIDMMSAGTKRIIWLLANLFSAKYTGVSIIAIEEIETSIHPKLLKTLLEIISELSKEVSILITSHSPLLIQYLKPESLYVGNKDESGCISFSKIKQSKMANVKGAAKKRGMNIGEFIFDVISKDTESSSILNTILEESND